NKLSKADIHGGTVKIGKDSFSKDQFFKIARERFKRYNLPAPKSFDDIINRLQRRKDLLKMEGEWGARTSEESKGFKTAYPSFTFKDLQRMKSFRKGFYEYPVVRVFGLPEESMAPKKILYDTKGRKVGRELGMLVDVRKIRPGKTFDLEHPTKIIRRTIPQEIYYKLGRSLYPSEYKKPESRWSPSERSIFKTVGYPFKPERFNAEYKGRYVSPNEYVSNQEKKLLGGKIK
ncbi:MAG: hypothetical protein Q8N71_04140, partial [candidate division Zixibacteria bacterium]|nr:hypothetical protein [candidate division Zixibacteria bacterium]